MLHFIDKTSLATKLKLMAMLFITAFSIVGCDGTTKNFDIDTIDQQIIRVRGHIVEISKEKGYYINEDIDFDLMNEAKRNAKESGEKLMLSYHDGGIEKAIWHDGINKMVTLLHFIWMEQVTWARKYESVDQIKLVKDEYQELMSDQEMQDWLEMANKKEEYLVVLSVIEKAINIIDQKKQITEEKGEIEDLLTVIENMDSTENVAEYNKKVEEYNQNIDNYAELIEKYNENILSCNEQCVCDSFQDMMEIGLLFPGQNTIEMESMDKSY